FNQHRKVMEEAAHVIAKINHLNKTKTDLFLHVLLEHRPDLAGLPLVMGEACRMSKKRSKAFAEAVPTVRQAVFIGEPEINPARSFWKRYGDHKDTEPGAAEARVAALMQMLAPESAEMRVGLADHIASLSQREAGEALAKLAVFSPEEDVRQRA